MNPITTLIKNIYQKNKEIFIIDTSFCITLNKILSYNSNNLQYLKNIVSYLFYISPLHYYYLLFFVIPKQYNTYYSKKIDKIEHTNNMAYDKIKEILNWSNRELQYHKPIIDKILNNQLLKSIGIDEKITITK